MTADACIEMMTPRVGQFSSIVFEILVIPNCPIVACKTIGEIRVCQRVRSYFADRTELRFLNQLSEEAEITTVRHLRTCVEQVNFFYAI